MIPHPMTSTKRDTVGVRGSLSREGRDSQPRETQISANLMRKGDSLEDVPDPECDTDTDTNGYIYMATWLHVIHRMQNG